MSIQKEPSGRRFIQVEAEVPGTPEEVWQAIATGPGISSWFVPTEVDEEKGTIVNHFGPGMDSDSTLTAWEPPHRFAEGGHSLGPDAPAVATEWIVEARSGGVCVVRVVHSLFASTDDWDKQLESLESGWPAFFRILRLYLTHFRGQSCTIMQTMAITAQPVSEAWSAFAGPLGLAGLGVGQPWKSAPGAPAAAGHVEDVGKKADLLLRLEEPATGVAYFYACGMGPQSMVGVSMYLYGDTAAQSVAAIDPAWDAWLKEHFPAAAETSTA